MKVTIVYSHTQSHWLSCQYITRNLLESYSKILPLDNASKCQLVNFHKDLTFFEIESLAQQILSFKPSTIIFLDHTPHPIDLIKTYFSLLKISDQKIFPSFIFHVYGDFTLLSENWLGCEKILKNFKIKWICASDAQVQLVREFIKNKSNTIFEVPFPIDNSTFYYDRAVRLSTRKLLKFNSKEVVFVYTGRLSYQKRVLTLINFFQSYLKSTNIPSRLILAGPFDNIGSPYTGEYFQDGEFTNKFISYFNLLSPETKKRISYLGCVEEGVLQNIYNASDIYISLSTYNDEDYGMAPAEALCTGLPAILTNWGGYTSFKKSNNEVYLIPTKINENKPKIDIDSRSLLNSALELASNINDFQKSRAQKSKININYLGIKFVSIKLDEILNFESDKFNGFSSNMQKVNQISNRSAPYIKSSFTFSELYSDLYENYISKKL